MINVTALNVPEAFTEMLLKMRHYVVPEQTRNGPVRAFQCPVTLTISNPWQRVLTDPTRDANPFFHAMEFVWMMAGSNDSRWISQFNKRMMEFSDDGRTQYAAYGYRWRKWFQLDQAKKAIVMLKRNPQDRRIVIAMWDGANDLGFQSKDLACNTHIYFRVVEGKLDMTVMNRSNDIIWGMLGANAVHMTMLHELIALAAGLRIGYYRVVSNNAHIYESVPNFNYYMTGVPHDDDVYFRHRNSRAVVDFPLLKSGETYADFVADCEQLVNYGDTEFYRTQWMAAVGAPIYRLWYARKVNGVMNPAAIAADDWRIACEEWIGRRRNPAVDNQPGDDYRSVVAREQTSASMGSGTVQPVPVADVDNSGCEVGISTPESGADCTVSSEPF